MFIQAPFSRVIRIFYHYLWTRNNQVSTFSELYIFLYTINFRESIHLGETDFTASEVREMIKSLGGDFRGDRYHLISRNCNHFSAVFAKTLTGREIPGWINRLANISGSIPFLDRMLPQEWLTPVALQQSLERKKSIDVAEEATETVGVRHSLNGPSSTHRNNSRTTVLEGKTSSGDMGSGSADSLYATSNGSAAGTGKSVQSAQSNAGSSSPSLQRIWTQLKSSIGGVETTLKF
ncbi:hypothetical protein WR25_01556 [Diploscapter pachys]|uniref:PPPDE domain-containing protein n=1 Tax=Diploscapter pachys TaxID=2018661 RepID=A0A2A2K5H9_9BILA|nr:hypothetical protein WR25_01556 [Diploscapter pachys]